MIECQSWYNQYREAIEANDVDSLSPNPNAEWISSLDALAYAVSELDSVLAIFSPEAQEAMAEYIHADYEMWGVLGLEVASRELGKSLEINVETGTMDATFSKALNELRQFIAANFKPDEVFAASQKGRPPFYG